MGKIRSAWEIALERTEGLQIDKDRIREKADIDSARKAAGQFLSDDDGIDEMPGRAGEGGVEGERVQAATLEG